MMHLQKPSFEVSDIIKYIYDFSINACDCNRLILVQKYLVESERKYDLLGREGRLYEIEQTSKDLSIADFYDRYIVKKRPRRLFYNGVISLAQDGLCPYCKLYEADTIDHFLPKSRYGLLAVTPANLVPACYKCNKLKDRFVVSVEKNLPHPYFDECSVVWLRAELRAREDGLPYVVFVVDQDLNCALYPRIKFLFELFNLALRYQLFAVIEMKSIKRFLEAEFSDRGIEGVRKWLSKFSESLHGDDLNSWKAALYRCLANSTPYCSGLFKNW